MDVAFVASPGETASELCALLAEHLPDDALCCCDPKDLRSDQPVRRVEAAFVLILDVQDLSALRALTGIYPAMPIAVISKKPDFALEAIRQGARDYLICPLLPEDIDHAARRLGLNAGRRFVHGHFDTG